MIIWFVAHYLPQFYESPENNGWRGKVGADWAVVKGARPLSMMAGQLPYVIRAKSLNTDFPLPGFDRPLRIHATALWSVCGRGNSGR